MIKNRVGGFTIIELIVVVAIIGVLIAILVPALSGTRMRANKLSELNLLSQVGKAWTMYIGDHQDKVLPGFLSTEVQDYKELAWAFPDESLVPPAPSYTDEMPNYAGPWTFRLLDYFDYDWRSILFYRDTDEWVSRDLREYADIVATQPAFGYNGYYIGGWQTMDAHTGRPFTTFQSVVLTNGERMNVVAKSASSIPRADQTIIFCSSFYARPGMYYQLDDDTPGSFLATPSVLARVPKWVVQPGNEIESRFDSFAPLGRFTGMPAVGFADGSVEAVDIEQLLDQQLWIPKAKPVGDTPASEFSHTVD